MQLFSIDIKSSKLKIFKNTKFISVNVLSKKQKFISNNHHNSQIIAIFTCNESKKIEIKNFGKWNLT